jgi:hypothetical protein
MLTASIASGIVSHLDRDGARMSNVTVREATAADLPRIVELLAQLYSDPTQEDYAAARERYDRAYAEIVADKRQTLLVAESGSEIAGSLVLIIVPNLTQRATTLRHHRERRRRCLTPQRTHRRSDDAARSGRRAVSGLPQGRADEPRRAQGRAPVLSGSATSLRTSASGSICSRRLAQTFLCSSVVFSG